MRSTPRILASVALVSVTGISSALAHPGHSHADIPSLIRHPFAGPEHLLGSAVAGIALGALAYFVSRRATAPAFVRWTSAGVVAIATTFALAAI